MRRRVFLQATLASGAIGVALGAGLLAPREVLAAWPKAAFDAKGGKKAVPVAIKAFHGSDATIATNKIKIKAPDIAENGRVVPVTVSTKMGNVEQISILVESNPAPMNSSYDLAPNALGFVSTRMKMGKTSNVIAVVKSGGKLYSARKEVKVTIGGCGG